MPEGGLADQDINVINTLTTTGKLTLYCSDYSISKKVSFRSEIGSRSITEYSDGANILIAALLKETSGAEASNKSIIPTLLTALGAFKSAPYYAIKHEPAKLGELWSVLEKRYPALQTALEKFKTIFGEVNLLYCQF